MATVLGWLAAIGSVLILAAISLAIIAGVRAFLDQLWVLIR
jgi:negative regulator of sigma E activity